MTGRRLRLGLLGIGIGAAVLAPAVLPPFAVTILSLVFIAAILASSIDLLAGQAGLVSIGHAGIAAAAAYAVAWATLRDLGPGVQLLLALLVTLVVSAVYALTTMRTNGIVFLMITLALGITVHGLAIKLSSLTGGQNGLTGLTRPDVVGSPTIFYGVAAAAFAATAVFRWLLAASPFGLVLRGVRESESRMASLGYSVARAKFVAVMLSGLLAGVAGVLTVWHAQFMSPNVASFGRSAMAVVMVILGGAGTLLGPLVGAGVVVGTEHWLSSYVDRWPTLLGLVFIAAVLFAPGGVAGALGRRRPGSSDRRASADLASGRVAPPLLDDRGGEAPGPPPQTG
jgi:branched-chain amino acid transport system permease protein